MTDERDLEQRLQTHFAAARQHDAQRAPSFASMMANAHAEAAESPRTPLARVSEPATSRSLTDHTSPRAQRWQPALVIAWSAPMLAAAALAIMFMRAPSAADEEFEQLVSQWSQTHEALRSPTDRLLVLPGSEYLRSTPTIGEPRPRNPS